MSVTTKYATTLSEDEITLNGSLDDLHGEISLDVSFEYGTSTSYGSTTSVQSLTSLGDFSASLTASALDKFHSTQTIYYFRAKVTDGTTTWYGNNRYFINLNIFGADPYVIDDDMNTGTLTDTAIMNDSLVLAWFHGMNEKPEFSNMTITGGTIT